MNYSPFWVIPFNNRASQGGTMIKNSPANPGSKGDTGLIPGLVRSPGGGNGNPFLYSCLENYMDRGTLWAAVHGVPKRVGHSQADAHTPPPPDLQKEKLRGLSCWKFILHRQMNILSAINSINLATSRTTLSTTEAGERWLVEIWEENIRISIDGTFKMPSFFVFHGL